MREMDSVSGTSRCATILRACSVRATSQSRKPARPIVSSSRNTARPKIFAAMVCLKARAFAQIGFWVVSIAAREFLAVRSYSTSSIRHAGKNVHLCTGMGHWAGRSALKSRKDLVSNSRDKAVLHLRDEDEFFAVVNSHE